MLEYIALLLIIFVGLTLFYGIIVIHDIPYEIAKHRNHPHQDAIHVAGWVSLFTLHVLWPFLWIWATLYRPNQGWGFSGYERTADHNSDSIKTLTQRIRMLEERISQLEGN